MSAVVVLLLGCSSYRSIDAQPRVPGWSQGQVSCDEPPACDAAPSRCVCAERPTWQLRDVNQNSDRFMQSYSLDAFDGKVTVLSFYKVDCAFCGQQMGYLQVLKDDLANDDYPIEFATMLKKSGEVGTTCSAASDCTAEETCEEGFCHSEKQKVMSRARNSHGACAFYDSPNCTPSGEDDMKRDDHITITYPVYQDTEAVDAWHSFHDEGSKDEIFVYRSDGRLGAYYSASERIVLSDRSQYAAFKTMLKAMSLGEVACDANTPCAEGQWCRRPELDSCGASGVCTPTLETGPSGVPLCPVDLYPQPVCGCDQRTYNSACAAAAQSVSLFDHGQCLD